MGVATSVQVGYSGGGGMNMMVVQGEEEEAAAEGLAVYSRICRTCSVRPMSVLCSDCIRSSALCPSVSALLVCHVRPWPRLILSEFPQCPVWATHMCFRGLPVHLCWETEKAMINFP